MTIAVHSKQGDTKLHANEDRATTIADLNAELDAKRPADMDLSGAPPADAVPPAHSFFAVYDGHGGAKAAMHAANRLHVLLGADLAQWRRSAADSMRAAFARTEAELRRTYESHPEEKSGTCACAALLRGHQLHVGWVGDCRALLLRSEHHPQPCVQLTTDHRATEANEARRVLKAGGQISDGRVWGALMPSRTLGDFPWKDKGPGLSAEPEMTRIDLTDEDKYLVIGSDGVFDALSNKQVARLVCKMGSSAQKVCNELVKEIKKKPSGDDTTVIVVQLGAKPASPGQRG